MSIELDDLPMEEIEQRFGSNKAALSDYLQRRRAAGLPDHRRAGTQRAEQRPPAAPAAIVEARKPGVGPTSAKPSVPPPPAKPRALSAQEQAEARRDAVMASPHAKGRATTAAGLLGGAPNLSAEEIIAALRTLPETPEMATAKVVLKKWWGRN